MSTSDVDGINFVLSETKWGLALGAASLMPCFVFWQALGVFLFCFGCQTFCSMPHHLLALGLGYIDKGHALLC